MKKKRSFKRGMLLLLALAVIIGGALAVWNMRLTDITVVGCSYYSDDELIARVFPEAKYFRTVYTLWNTRFGEEQDIPFIKSYDLTITGLHSAQIVVYEKNIIGYIPYMGNYLYFDTDGYIVETSTEKVDGLLFIDGINFNYFVLNNQLPVTDSKIFAQTLVLSQIVRQEELAVDRVYFDKDLNITLYTEDISVYLGQGTGLESKLHTLKDILPQLSGQQGTLYLDNYSTVNDTVEYIFKRDKATEE
jgi:cell division protein FtsQ